MVLGAIQQRCSDYYEAIPQGAARAVMKSAIYSFMFSLRFKNDGKTINLDSPLISAGMAATASLIHALATPIFKYAFEGYSDLMHYQLSAYFFDILLVQSLMNHFTSLKVELFLPSSNYILNFPDKLFLTVFSTSFYICDKIFREVGVNDAFYTRLNRWLQTRDENSIYFFV